MELQDVGGRAKGKRGSSWDVNSYAWHFVSRTIRTLCAHATKRQDGGRTRTGEMQSPAFRSIEARASFPMHFASAVHNLCCPTGDHLLLHVPGPIDRHQRPRDPPSLFKYTTPTIRARGPRANYNVRASLHRPPLLCLRAEGRFTI